MAAPARSARLTTRDQLTLSCLWFCLNFQSAALLPIVIPVQIALFVAPGAVGGAPQAIYLGWLSALGAVIALLTQPIIGAISDRTVSRWGKRRPHIAWGAVLLIAGMLALGYTTDVTVFILGFAVMNFANNVVTAAYQGLLPDLVPNEQRGAASGYLGFMTILGNVGALVAAGIILSSVNLSDPRGTGTHLAVFYVLATAVTVIGLPVTLLGIHERRVARDETPPKLSWRELWLAPWRHANFTWVFLTRAFVLFGITLFLTFIEYYFANVAHVTDFVGATASVALLALLGAVGSALVLGIVSDHTPRAPVVCLATVCMAGAAAMFVIMPGRAPLAPLGLLFGVGYGAYTSVDWALAIDALPSQDHLGKDMGIWNLASALPAVLAPLAGSALIAGATALGQTATGYLGIFLLATICLLLGAALVLRVRIPESHFAEAPVEP